jgi:hypothetical protein
MIPYLDGQLDRLVLVLLQSGKHFGSEGQLDIERLVRDARAIQAEIKRIEPEKQKEDFSLKGDD